MFSIGRAILIRWDLLRSVPRLDRPRGAKLETIEGLPPNLANMQTGCRFAPRCPFKIAICETEPALLPTDTGGLSRCHRHEEIAAGKLVWGATSSNLQQPVALSQRRAVIGAQPDQDIRSPRRFPRRERRVCARCRM